MKAYTIIEVLVVLAVIAIFGTIMDATIVERIIKLSC